MSQSLKEQLQDAYFKILKENNKLYHFDDKCEAVDWGDNAPSSETMIMLDAITKALSDDRLFEMMIDYCNHID